MINADSFWVCMKMGKWEISLRKFLTLQFCKHSFSQFLLFKQSFTLQFQESLLLYVQQFCESHLLQPKEPVCNGHSRSYASIALLHKLHRDLVHLLNLTLKHLISDKTSTGAHNPGDATVSEHVRCHHSCQVSNHSSADTSGHLSKANVTLTNIKKDYDRKNVFQECVCSVCQTLLSGTVGELIK